MFRFNLAGPVESGLFCVLSASGHLAPVVVDAHLWARGGDSIPDPGHPALVAPLDRLICVSGGDTRTGGVIGVVRRMGSHTPERVRSESGFVGDDRWFQDFTLAGEGAS